MWDSNTNKTGSTTLKEWTTQDSRNTSSTTNLEEEETVDSPGNNGNESMPEQVKWHGEEEEEEEEEDDDDDDDDDDDFLETQHVLGINMSIFRSLRLRCWTNTLAVLFLICCVLELGCGSAWSRRSCLCTSP